MTGGFYGERSTMPPAEQQAREMGARLVLGTHPDATLVPGRMTAESASGFVVLQGRGPIGLSLLSTIVDNKESPPVGSPFSTPADRAEK